jgi:hypothetical protein
MGILKKLLYGAETRTIHRKKEYTSDGYEGFKRHYKDN